MKFTISLEKKHLYLLSGVFGILLGVIIANAFGGNNPSVMGHTWGEIAGFPAACPAGQVARGIGPSLTCVVDVDTRCDSPGINCALDANDLGPNSVGRSEVDSSICKSDGTNCRGYTLQIRKISEASNSCDWAEADKRTREGNCFDDCVNSGFGQCLFAQHPNCDLTECSTTSNQHTCTCQRIV